MPGLSSFDFICSKLRPTASQHDVRRHQHVILSQNPHDSPLLKMPVVGIVCLCDDTTKQYSNHVGTRETFSVVPCSNMSTNRSLINVLHLY